MFLQARINGLAEKTKISRRENPKATIQLVTHGAGIVERGERSKVLGLKPLA